MNFDRLFWKVASIALISALFYVGHGIHGSSGVSGVLPSAHATGVYGKDQFNAWVYTQSPDGKTVYYWETNPYGGSVEFKSEATRP